MFLRRASVPCRACGLGLGLKTGEGLDESKGGDFCSLYLGGIRERPESAGTAWIL